jgi:response regulator RpfG family c-di-GMP phosphodiesterase
MTHDEAARIIEAGSGSHFNPLLVDVFKDAAGEFVNIYERHKLESFNTTLP